VSARETLIRELDAVDAVASGSTVAIGGLGTSSHPMALIRELIRRDTRDLLVVAGPAAGLDVDLLIAAGCVREVVSSYVGAEHLAPIGPAFRRAAEEGSVVVREVDEGIYVQALRAAAQLVPYLTWRGGMGTSIPELNDHVKEVEDPFGGPPVLAVEALPVDVALLHADRADAYGNVQPVGTGYTDRLHSQAADLTLVQVEQVISNEEVRRTPWYTSLPDADGIVRAPFGAHPYASPGRYVEDVEHLQEYVVAARDGGGRLDDYLGRYVRGPADHWEYLEVVGLRRLFSLGEFG
jgi:glutaconate CoA-transferase, subunit A